MKFSALRHEHRVLTQRYPEVPIAEWFLGAVVVAAVMGLGVRHYVKAHQLPETTPPLE